MFQTKRNGIKRGLVVIMVLLFILATVVSVFASDARPTSGKDAQNTYQTYIHTDGSTTVFPIIELAAYQYSAYFPTEHITIDSGNGTGSGHGQQALMNQLPVASSNSQAAEPLDIALSSGTCSGNNAVPVTQTSFTEGSFTNGTGTTALNCTSAAPNDLIEYPIAKDGILVLVSNVHAACIAASTNKYISTNMVTAIWGGFPYDAATDTVTTTGTLGVPGTVQHTWKELWDQCDTGSIVPRSRKATSGTRSAWLDFNGGIKASYTVNGTKDAAEAFEVTTTGKNRLDASSDMEAAISNQTGNDANGNPLPCTAKPALQCGSDQIGYAGLAFDNTYIDSVSVAKSLNPGVGAAVKGSAATVADDTYTYSRYLYMFYKDGNTKVTTNLLGWMWSSLMQSNIQKTGEVPLYGTHVSLPTSGGNYVSYANVQPPAPNWDVNADGCGGLLDISSLGASYGKSAPVSGDPNFPLMRGWVRGDVNYDGTVDLLDVSTFGSKWGKGWGVGSTCDPVTH